MRTILFFTAFLFAHSVWAQPFVHTIDFEQFPSTTDTFYVNYSNPGNNEGFGGGGVYFPCVYDTAWGGFWSWGWAWSNIHDSVTAGIGNQYAAKTLLGASGSSTYAVSFGVENYVTSDLPLSMFNHFYITNSTYAYESMKHGDLFAKKFGGADGQDEDWFKVTISGYLNGSHLGNDVDVYLADYRFQDSSQDYILKDWLRVDVGQSIPLADSLTFVLSSSDTGAFGMNTPAYFCIDDLLVEGLSDIKTNKRNELTSVQLYPNPAQDYIHLKVAHTQAQPFRIVNLQGKIIFQAIFKNETSVNIASLPAGNYFLITPEYSTCFTKQ